MTGSSTAVAWLIDLSGLSHGLPFGIIAFACFLLFLGFVVVDKVVLHRRIGILEESRADLRVPAPSRTVTASADPDVAPEPYLVPVYNHGPAGADRVTVDLMSITPDPFPARTKPLGRLRPPGHWNPQEGEVNPSATVGYMLLTVFNRTVDGDTQLDIQLETDRNGQFRAKPLQQYCFHLRVSARNPLRPVDVYLGVQQDMRGGILVYTVDPNCQRISSRWGSPQSHLAATAITVQ